MSKKEFLSQLEKRLSILNEQERRETIDEYRDIIEEKVKHGKTTKEAIEEFGSIDELAKEILSAYKIDPEYGKKKDDDLSKVVDGCENLIKKGAQKLSDFTNDAVKDFKKSNREITPELIFEVLIKLVLLLVVFAVLRLPFMLISYIGESIFSFGPFDSLLGFGWNFISGILYIIFCMLVTIMMFREYFNGGKFMEPEKAAEKKASTKNNETQTKAEKKTTDESKTVKTDQKNEDVVVEKKTVREEPKRKQPEVIIRTTFSDVLMVVAKIFIVMMILIPLVFLDFGIFTGIAFVVFFLFKGFDVLGLLLILIGLALLFGLIIRLIFNLLAENKKKTSFVPFVLSAIVIIVGGVFFINTISKFKYIDGIPKSMNVKAETKVVTEKFSENQMEIENYSGDVEVIEDALIPTDTVQIELDYYKGYSTVETNRTLHTTCIDQNGVEHGEYEGNFGNGELDERICTYKNKDLIDVSVYSDDHGLFNTLYGELIMDDLKHNQIHDYSILDTVVVRVRVNPASVNKIIAD